MARETVTPPTSTGFRCATGVRAPGAAHLHLDALDVGHRLPRAGYLYAMAQRGDLGGESEQPLLLDGIHLQHHAIDFVGQFLAPRLPSRRRTPALLPRPGRAGGAGSP